MDPDSAGAGKVYREVVEWPLWFHLLMGAVSVFALWGCVAAVRDPDPAWLPPVLCLTALSLLGVWWFVRHLEIEVGPDGVAYGFGRIRRRVPRKRISGLEVETYSLARYMGWGYRIGWGKGDRAYSLIGYRRGLRVHFTDDRGKEWHIFLSSADPDGAVEAYDVRH